jgi:hypothetical protein
VVDPLLTILAAYALMNSRNCVEEV